ncbi:MAG: insulinase family protein [Saprospiraceae bacterium]|nr:insulinase family protein [Saprospiraceae bacterium]
MNQASAQTLSTTNAQNSDPKAEKVTSVEGITEYKLPNGLRFLVFPDNSKQTITVNITYLVGSRHEGYGETGMAHLLEHLVFKGTPRHPDIPSELSSHGARPNGTTWYDRTNYFETFSATEENLRWALDLEADRMVNSFIAKKDLDSEMSVVRNEYESGENSPTGVLMKRVMSTAYLWHNYGNTTIGARADIENVPIDRLQAFYRKYYQPDNAVLVVAGKIDEKKVVDLVTEYFGKIPKPERELIPTYTEEPVQDGERLVTLKRVGDVQAVACMYHIPPGAHPDAAAFDVLTDILTSEPSGRLYKALVETKKASSIWGWCATLKEPGFAYFNAQVRKENDLEDAKNTLIQTLDGMKSNPATKEEVERSITKKLKDFDLLFNNTEALGRRLSEYIGMGDWRLTFLYRDHIRKVTQEDVQRVAHTYLKPSNRTVGLFIPEEKPDRSEIPSAPDIAALLKGYKGDPPKAQGEDFDPSPMNIEKRTKRGQESNSIKWALLPKSTKGNMVNATMTLYMGDENSLKNKAVIANYTAAMLDRGTKTMSRQQIKDELDKLKARVNFYESRGQVTASVQTTKDNLSQVLSMVNDMLKNPAFSEKEFEELRNEDLANLEEQKSDPQSLVRLAYTKHLSPYPKGDIRYTMSLEEEMEAVKNLKIDELRSFHKEFYGSTNASVAIVGDFDENAIKSQLVKDFGKWKSSKPYARITAKYNDAPKKDLNIETPDKANAMFLAGCNIAVRDDDPEYPALVMANYILGGGFLNSRLATRIRQKEGISYGVGSQLNAESLDRAGNFTVYAIYAPENRDRLEQAFKEEIEKMLKDGFTDKELEEAKSGILQSRKVTRSQDNSLASGLSYLHHIGRTYQFTEDFEKKLSTLTVDQVNQAIKKHVSLDKISMVKGGDFANKLKKP